LATQADNEQISKFREDARFLLTLYTNVRMDEALGFKGNLSGYVNGHKNPSEEKIRKFYQVYGKDLERYNRQLSEKPGGMEDGPLPGSHYIAELKNIRNNLSLITDLLTSRQHLQELAELNARLDRIEHLLLKDNPPK